MRNWMLVLVLVSGAAWAAPHLCSIEGVDTSVVLVVRNEGPGFTAFGTTEKTLSDESEVRRFVLTVNTCVIEFLAEERWCMSGYRDEVHDLEPGQVRIEGYCK